MRTFKTSELFKIRLDVAADAGAAVAAAIEPLVDSVTWSADEDDPTSTVVAFAESPLDRAALLQALASVGQPPFTIEQIGKRDWLAENKADFPPIRAGRFFIHVADYAGVIPAGTIALRVPPAGAFGSGRHGSTQGCLAALDGLRRLPPGPVLDVGCGSGILGLAAARVWRRPVLGVDIDPRAVAETLANARTNGVAALIDAVVARGYAHAAVQRHKYALIFANILAAPLCKMAEETARAVRPGGVVILSGLLLSEAKSVAARHRAAGLTLVRRIPVEGWMTLVMRKGGA
jgi:ribosomal protein L11 methyltransferase